MDCEVFVCCKKTGKIAQISPGNPFYFKNSGHATLWILQAPPLPEGLEWIKVYNPKEFNRTKLIDMRTLLTEESLEKWAKKNLDQTD